MEPRALLAGECGLSATYFDRADFGGDRVSRIDAAIDFAWPAGDAGSPAPGIGADTFSVAWSGSIEPAFTEDHTFHLTLDGGARLWVDGKLLIDTWTSRAPAASSIAIPLVAGKKVPIGLEFFDEDGAAQVRLEWEGAAGQARQVIPQARLSSDLPPAPALRIMPLGDSITEARGRNDLTTPGNIDRQPRASYRFWTYKQLAYGGIAPDFVGSMAGHFEGIGLYTNQFDLDHEGHWGWRADQVLAQIDAWAAAARPDVLLLHLGSNDLLQGQSPASTIAEVGQVIDAVRVHSPYVKVLLAQLIPYADDLAGRVVEFNALVPGLAAAKQAVGSPVVVVDQFTGFNVAADTYDGVHPNEAGEKKMADRWVTALRALVGNGAEADARPPALESARILSPTSIRVRFTEPVALASATALANYALDGGATISAVALADDLRTVTLTTSAPLTLNGTYALTISGVADRSPAANAIAPGSAQATLTFHAQLPYRAINLGGIPVLAGGVEWEGDGAPRYAAARLLDGYHAGGLDPAVPEARLQSVIRSFVYNFGGADVALFDVPAGTYRVYVWVVEDDRASTFDLLLEGAVVRPAFNSGGANRWHRVGPFDVTVADGTLNLATVGGDANLAGIEVDRLFPTGTLAGTEGDDAFHLRLDPTGQVVQVFLNRDPATEAPDLVIPASDLGALTLLGLGGDDVLTVDRSNAAFPFSAGDIAFDGGAGDDALVILAPPPAPGSQPAPFELDVGELVLDEATLAFQAVERLTLAGGTHDIVADLAGLRLTLDGAEATFLASARPEALSLEGTARVTLAPAAGGAGGAALALHAGSLALSPAALLDLTDGALALRPAAQQALDAALAALFALVQAGRNGGDAGPWSGPAGITSSVARSDAEGGPGILSLLTLLNRDAASGGPLLPALGPWPLDADTVVVRLGLHGDVDLNGTVDAADYFHLDAGRALGLSGYAHGDLDYSGGTTTADDYLLADTAFLRGGAAQAAEPSPQVAAAAGAPAAPPAPSATEALLPLRRRADDDAALLDASPAEVL